jgi:predicted nucleic acid-binding protein
VANADPAPLYLDTSAIVKLIAEEAESADLVEAVTGGRLVSSEIAIAEVPRALRRIAAERPSTSSPARMPSWPPWRWPRWAATS